MTFRALLAVAGALTLAIALSFAKAPANRQDISSGGFPAAADDRAPMRSGLQDIVLAGGCFWGVQGVFQHVAGVEQALAGYAGGAAETARYAMVATGGTGHAEAVRVTYDPKRVSLGQILRIFFTVAHDPTQLNRQGPDVGTQYRSAIFIADAAQERVVRNYLAQIAAARPFLQPLATRVEGLADFFPAEPEHQDYLIRHPDAPYVIVNDRPKIEALKTLFPALYRDAPKRVGETG